VNCPQYVQHLPWNTPEFLALFASSSNRSAVLPSIDVTSSTTRFITARTIRGSVLVTLRMGASMWKACLSFLVGCHFGKRILRYGNLEIGGL
jgi:hypothetical protein